MVPAMDLALTVDMARRLPNFMVVWGHPDIAEQTLARAVDLTKKHNAEPANSGNQWPLPGKVSNNRGLPGVTVFRMDTPAQEEGLKNTWQLNQGQMTYANTETKEGLSVSNMPVKCIYEVCGVFRNLLDRAEFERMMWFSWALQPLDVNFQDANNNVFTHRCPKFLAGDPKYSFETVDDVATQLTYKVNWQLRLDGHWLKSRFDPISMSILNTYQEIIDGNPVIINPLEEQLITPDDIPDENS